MKKEAANDRSANRRARAETVDEYLAAVPAQARAELERLRKIIRTAAPNATEVISYQIPMFKQDGPLVSFAAFKEHCSFFVMSPAVMEAFDKELAKYETSKGTIRFAAGQPIPATLVRKLVLARIKENQTIKRK
jgi:uncharacterized protein YdhG (YjbR/CyaY superfamily)